MNAGITTLRLVAKALLGLLLAALLAGAGMAAPQTFDTALPVAEGEFVFREQFLYVAGDDDPTPAGRSLEVIGAMSALGYGVTGDLALFGVLPYLDKRLELTDGLGGRLARSTRGIGDARLFARYTIVQDDRPGATFRVAPVAGIELPTGDDNDADSFGRLPPPLQLGSGSWDPFAAVVATYQTLDYQIDAQVAYKVNSKANGLDFGDELSLEASLQYRLWPHTLGAGVPAFVYGVVEANLVHQERSRSGGVADLDSGGTTLFVSPGLQYVTKRCVLEAIVQLPVVKDLNGAALESDVMVRAGFRVNF